VDKLAQRSEVEVRPEVARAKVGSRAAAEYYIIKREPTMRTDLYEIA